MKTFFKAAFALALLITLVGCGDTNNNQNEVSDNVDIALDSLRDDGATNRDAEFVEDLREENAEAIAMLRTASSMGTDARMKQAAQSMLAEHRAFDERLRELALSKGHEPESLTGEDSTTDAANEKPGSDWDDKWADRMESHHMSMLRDVDDYSARTTDAALLALLKEIRQKLAEHHAESKELAGRLKG